MKRVPQRCRLCRGTGWRRDGTECSCSAQPFHDSEPPSLVKPALNQGIDHASTTWFEADAIDVESLAAHHELTEHIERILEWSSTTVGELVRLSQWISFLERGGPPDIAARAVLAIVPEVVGASEELAELVERLRWAALDATS